MAVSESILKERGAFDLLEYIAQNADEEVSYSESDEYLDKDSNEQKVSYADLRTDVCFSCVSCLVHQTFASSPTDIKVNIKWTEIKWSASLWYMRIHLKHTKEEDEVLRRDESGLKQFRQPTTSATLGERSLGLVSKVGRSRTLQ